MLSERTITFAPALALLALACSEPRSAPVQLRDDEPTGTDAGSSADAAKRDTAGATSTDARGTDGAILADGPAADTAATTTPDGATDSIADAQTAPDQGPAPADGPPPSKDGPSPVLDGPSLLALGALCTSSAGCASGHCIDGVCCDSACSGSCVQCNLSSSRGTCKPVTAGATATGRTPCRTDAPETCGQTGKCDGAGKCAVHPSSTVCRSAMCTGNTAMSEAKCDGMGACRPAMATTCAGQTPLCLEGQCVGCTGDEHCQSPDTCSRATCDTATKRCVVTQVAGLPCGGNGSCSAQGTCRTPIQVNAFTIDATEVTKGQYAAFLAAKGTDTSGQPDYCTWNDSYVPTAEWPPTGDKVGLPANWVDWCDAYAYCKWAGKRLCGRIGGGSVPHNDYDKATVSQWHAACSAGGTRIFPYGDTFQAGICTLGAAASAPVAAGSSPGCEGGYPGLFDMSGNVVEWEDSCVAYTGKSDLCRERGGSYYSPAGPDGKPGLFIQCDSNNNNTRGSTDRTRGFRCCKD